MDRKCPVCGRPIGTATQIVFDALSKADLLAARVAELERQLKFSFEEFKMLENLGGKRVAELEKSMGEASKEIGVWSRKCGLLEAENAQLKTKIAAMIASHPMAKDWNDPAEDVWNEKGKDDGND